MSCLGHEEKFSKTQETRKAAYTEQANRRQPDRPSFSRAINCWVSSPD